MKLQALLRLVVGPSIAVFDITPMVWKLELDAENKLYDGYAHVDAIVGPVRACVSYHGDAFGIDLNRIGNVFGISTLPSIVHSQAVKQHPEESELFYVTRYWWIFWHRVEIPEWTIKGEERA